MEFINTYIILDLETSGLPQGGIRPTRITEIALVAARRDHILDKHDGISKENSTADILLPRVIHKINLPVYPCKIIHPMASVMTGLTNDNLAQQKPFDEGLYNLLNVFIERLEKPVCLVAHNGNCFDFPILQAELSKLNKMLPEEVFCADTLPGFRSVLTDEENSVSSGNAGGDGTNNILGIKPLSCNDNVLNLATGCEWSNEEYDDQLIQAAEVAEKLSKECGDVNRLELDMRYKLEMERIKKINERTPTRRRSKLSTEHCSDAVHVKRKLIKDNQPKRKFNMTSLYKSLTGRDIENAHRAETDALALLECITAVGTPILEWLDKNKVPFRSVKKMW